ncbi:hypothetical protein FGB62_160g07 [Gracilaria domingensis]|nr:hypothetical protein FGB62_160g07 [Gracilaria domingensis]
MLKSFLQKNAKIGFTKLRMVEWERSFQDMGMDRKLSDAPRRVWQLIATYQEALRDAGYINSIDECSEVDKAFASTYSSKEVDGAHGGNNPYGLLLA